MKKNYSIKTFSKPIAKSLKRLYLLTALCILATGSYAQLTYTFTNASAVGRFGPSQTQINAAYTGTNNLTGMVVATGGIQTWTATGGIYKITAIGATGGNSTLSTGVGGLGTSMVGEFNIPAGSVIKILVGQRGEIWDYNTGGGGGTFVWINGQPLPLIVAGGGGGAGYSTNGVNASTLTAGTLGVGVLGTPGNNGNGANPGGGGWLTDGVNIQAGACAAKCSGNTAGLVVGGASPLTTIVYHGCAGSTTTGDGGFGGGSGGGGNCTTSFGGGGGGGYSGGVGQSGTTSGGGGGGSYNGGTNQVNTSGVGNGNGLVIIQELCNISVYGSTSNSVNPAICSGQSLTLTTNAVSTYSWSTGATTSSIVVSPTSTTGYTLSAMSASNCMAYSSITVSVSVGQPTLSVTSSTNQTCLGKTATITASGALTYTWTNGVSNGISFYPSATNTYTVSGQNGCGTTTAVTTISVSPLAMTAVSSATAVCTNKTATLSITAAANSYTWNPGNVMGTSPNLIVNPQANTNYTITASDGTCSGVANVSLVANPVPTINSSSSSTIVCPGGTINLSATGGINYTWTPVNLNGSSITVSPTASTLYNVVGDNSFGCLNNSSQVIVAGTQPTVLLSSSSATICGGTSATLTASGANTYAWTGGPTTTVYVVSPTQLTTYTIVGTNSSSGCTDTKAITVDVFTPVIAITGNTAVCDGEAANLTASGAGGYVWNPGNLPFASIAVTPASNTTYTVSGMGTSGILNCPVSGTIHVVVNPNPTVTAAATPTAICPKETTTITASGASTYTWTGTSTTTVSTSIQVSSPNVAILVYTLTGTSALGCQSSISIPVTVFACTGMDQLTFSSKQLSVYPNPSNGEFSLQGDTEMDLNLMNELGQVIQSFRLNENNNHKVSVSNLSNGIYFLVGENVKQKIIVSK